MSDAPHDDRAFGTVHPDAPVTRAELERALRNLNLNDLELRDAVLQLGARLVSLTDELTRRLDGVEPEPAPPGTPAAPPQRTIEAAAMAGVPATLDKIRATDVVTPSRVNLDLGDDKYAVEPSTPPCDEVLHLCGARCCTFNFALSTLDLDEGVIRWDHGAPYLIRQRASDGYCVHNHPAGHHCTVHEFRPRVCRTYDCRDDPRIWIDFARRIPATVEASKIPPPRVAETEFDLMTRARAVAEAIKVERTSVDQGFADLGPRLGPKPSGQ